MPDLPIDLAVVSYGSKIPAKTWRPNTPEELVQLVKKADVAWIVATTPSPGTLRPFIEAIIDIDDATLAHLCKTHALPKWKSTPQATFLTLPFLHTPPHSPHLVTDQVTFIFGKTFIITIQVSNTPLFDDVRQQLSDLPILFEGKGPDFLLSVLLGAVEDACFWSIEMLRIRSAQLEQSIYNDGPTPALLNAIRQNIRQFLTFRQALDPFPMTFEKLFDPGSPFISSETLPHFTETLDRSRHLVSLLDNERDIVLTLHDTYRASQGDRTNTTINQLTMLLSVFIPLSFLTGVWGMNFDYMPELRWKLGYPFALTLMTAVVVSLLIYFRKKKLW